MVIAFYVVGSGFGNFDNERDPKEHNLLDSPMINTISITLPKKVFRGRIEDILKLKNK